MVEWLSASEEKPSWEEVAATSSVTKHYWEQWNALRLVGGVLIKKWVLKNGKVGFQQTVVPKVLQAHLLREM